MGDVRQQAATTRATGRPTQRGQAGPPEASGWAGWVLFGAMMMILLGAFHAVAGLVALLDDGYYVVRPNGLVIDLNYSAWGWVHLILGLVSLAAGFGLFLGAMWARVLGILVAGISAIVNFVFMAAYPFWSLTMITLDVLIIYAVAAHGEELQDLA
jgi:hypothetical protein